MPVVAIRFTPETCNQIPSFGGEVGEDVEAWLQEYNFITKGWEGNQRVMAIRTRLKDKARVWVQSLPPSIGFEIESLERGLRETFVQLSRRLQ